MVIDSDLGACGTWIGRRWHREPRTPMVSTSRIWCLAGRAPRRGEGDHQSEGARLGRPGLQASPEVDRGWKPASVNLALAAVDHFNRFLGLGPANVKREPIAQAAPRALTIDQQRDLLRAGEASLPRDRAIRDATALHRAPAL